MLQDALVRLDRLESEQILEQVNPVLQGTRFDAANVIVLGQELPFYPGYRFLDIADHRASPALRRFVIYRPGDVNILDFTNAPLYALNEKAPVRISGDTVADYARFFFNYVRGRHGRFIVVETVDDIPWREEPPPATRQALGKMLAPLGIIDRDNTGAFTLAVRMLFKTALFRARMHVDPRGFVQLTDEEVLVEDLPVLDDTLGQ